MEAKTKRMDALDGLRGLSAFSILLYHTKLMPKLEGGFEGVQVFFVLSGFLITTLLYQEWQRTGSIDLIHFYWRRLVRLVPAAAFFFGSLYLMFDLLITPPVVHGRTFLQGMRQHDVVYYGAAHFASVLNWTINRTNVRLMPVVHLWTLSIEQQFYFVWPVALLGLLLLRRTPLVVGVLAIVATASMLSPLAYPHASHLFYDLSTHTAAYPLLFGAMAAILVAKAPSFRMPPIAVALAFAGLVMHYFSVLPNVEADRFVNVLCATFVVVGCAQGTGIVAKALSIRPLTYLGSRSYAFYLWHLSFVISVCRRLPVLSQIIASTLATLFMAELSYRYVEEPALRFGKRFKSSSQIPSLSSLFGGRRQVESAAAQSS